MIIRQKLHFHESDQLFLNKMFMLGTIYIIIILRKHNHEIHALVLKSANHILGLFYSLEITKIFPKFVSQMTFKEFQRSNAFFS